MSLKNTSLSISLTTGEVASIGLLTSLQLGYSFDHNRTLTDGTGADKAQKVGTKSLSVVSDTPQELDLTAFVVGVSNKNVNFSKVKTIIVKNTAATGNLLIGGAASNAFSEFVADPSDIAVVHPGECLVLMDYSTGGTVDGTHKILKVAASAGTVTGSLVIVGEGADA